MLPVRLLFLLNLCYLFCFRFVPIVFRLIFVDFLFLFSFMLFNWCIFVNGNFCNCIYTRTPSPISPPITRLPELFSKCICNACISSSTINVHTIPNSYACVKMSDWSDWFQLLTLFAGFCFVSLLLLLSLSLPLFSLFVDVAIVC